MKYTKEVLERAKKAAEIGQAILEGKEVEYLCGDEWFRAENPLLYFSTYTYRLKPKQEYIPFTFEDAEYLIGKAIKNKTNAHVEIIDYISPTNVKDFTFDSLLEYFIFLDGTPCGKLKQ